ncbi:uncharacterized protein METZ01_LOCUS398145 [marine metagenome]|uniref:Uncharacterized protein n=1 Tax=marine metagenome TaxID=408172 RepID=A0A382VHC3_9ZZZZ
MCLVGCCYCDLDRRACAGTSGAAMTFLVDAREYVVVINNNRDRGGELVAFPLP